MVIEWEDRLNVHGKCKHCFPIAIHFKHQIYLIKSKKKQIRIYSFDLVRQCWNWKPNDRPNFCYIVNHINRILNATTMDNIDTPGAKNIEFEFGKPLKCADKNESDSANYTKPRCMCKH